MKSRVLRQTSVQMARAGLLLLLGAHCASCDRSPTAPAASPPVTQEPPAPLDSKSARYTELAEAVADSFLIVSDQPVIHRDFYALLADLNVKIVKCGRIQSRDQITQKIASMTHESGNAIIAESKSLEIMSVDSGFSDFAVGLLALVVGDHGKVVYGTESLLKKGETIEQQRLRWVHACNDYLAARLMLPEAAKQFAGAEYADGDAIAVDFDESFAGSADHDSVHLTNASGKALSNCTVLVEIIGANGDHCQNVHFVKKWPAGESRHAKYGIGMEATTGVYARRTAYGVQEVWVSVWADELSDEHIRLRYRGAPRDKDIAARLDGRLMIKYNYDAEGGFFKPGPVVTLFLERVPEIPDHALALSLRGNAPNGESRTGEWSWQNRKWVENEPRELSLASVLKFKPTEMEIIIRFPESTYEYRRKVQLESK